MRVDIPFKVVYEDDSTAQDRVRFVDYVAAERYFQLNMQLAYAQHGTEADLYCAWNALKRREKLAVVPNEQGQPEPISFPDWMLTLIEYEEIKEEGAKVSDEEFQEELEEVVAADAGKKVLASARGAPPG